MTPGITVAVVSTMIIGGAGIGAYKEGATLFQLGVLALCYGASMVALAAAK